MVISINSISEPIGSVKSWLRPDASTPLPGGWLICDGTTVSDSSSPFDGIALPDFRNRFPRGHGTLTNANFGADVNYFAGGTIPAGGNDSFNVNHSHTNPSHFHGITDDGSHNHGGSTLTTSISTPFTDGGGGAPVVTTNPHSHGINTQPHHSHGGQTSPASFSTSSALGSYDNKPPFRDLLLIIKVR